MALLLLLLLVVGFAQTRPQQHMVDTTTWSCSALLPADGRCIGVSQV